MSALGQKRIFCDAGAMSALPSKADIRHCSGSCRPECIATRRFTNLESRDPYLSVRFPKVFFDCWRRVIVGFTKHPWRSAYKSASRRLGCSR